MALTGLWRRQHYANLQLNGAISGGMKEKAASDRAIETTGL